MVALTASGMHRQTSGLKKTADGGPPYNALFVPFVEKVMRISYI